MYNADIEQYLGEINKRSSYAKRFRAFIPILSIFVIMIVFWCLKLTGITMAGEAFCGYDEHAHNDECTVIEMICTDPDHEHNDECSETTYTCGMEEHIHIADCYSDISADLETAEIWEQTIKSVPPELSTEQMLIAVAKTQLDYHESELNFTVDEKNEKHGYTRYGEWYGNPYGEWSTMFTSFCLHYAGLENMPSSAGAESMMMELEEKELYKPADEFSPYAGTIAFIDGDNDGTADTTAIVTEVTGASISVIEGDRDNKVSENSYELTDKSLMGYGILPPAEEDESSTVVEGEASDKNQTKPIKFAAARAAEIGSNLVGVKTNYNTNQANGNRFVIYAQGPDGNYYAIDGNGNAVRVFVDEAGAITTNSGNINSLLWNFTSANSYDGQNAHYIQNVATGKYIHPYNNGGNSYGAILTDKWETAVYYDGSGIKLRGARQNAYVLLNNTSTFNIVAERNSATVLYMGKVPQQVTVWLDGTNGGLNHAGGSPNQKYSVSEGSKFTLPTEWQSPTKYAQKLNGWYDVINGKYYKPGESVTVTGNMVFYADWIAQTYDVGQYNQYVADTVSTNDFVTTRVYDYNYLFNVMSQNAEVTVNNNSHSEKWNYTSGTVKYNNMQSLGLVFTDWDDSGKLGQANNRDKNNAYEEGRGVTSGIYNDRIGEALFDPEIDVIGREYLGTGDHLFQINNDPTSEYYGYYYYDCALNAASYNKTDQRFYVYEYLARTIDSSNNSAGKYSDILPFNSPYANTNDKDIVTYTYNGDNGEYPGVNHVQYDINDDSNNRVQANMAFGMSIEVDFYLPNVPGTKDANGEYGNQDLYGNDMHFEFSGDDDLWVLIDGKVALDVGGIHQVESGDINFSTGDVTVNGKVVGNVRNLDQGEHKLTILYLERGSSMSNCKIYFNLAPRFGMELQKEDVLTQELLNGAEFSVYLDRECTQPAQLWESKEANNNDEPSKNTFTVKNGLTSIWGFGAGNTYYIKETKPPNESGYGLSRGIIRMTFDKTGTASHSIEVIPELDANGKEIPITNGYTFHGFKIDEEKMMANVTITNAEGWVKETTTAQVRKKWNDKNDHTYDSVTAFLTVTDPDGTVRRIREITLSEENKWTYTWTNLPKYYEDGVTEIVYGVEEAYKEGYSPSVEKIDEIVIVDYVWGESAEFVNGGQYLLKTSKGFLSTTSETSNSLCWVNEETAKTSKLALWTTTVSKGNVMFANGAQKPQIIRFNSRNNSYFDVATTVTNKNMVVSGTNGLKIGFKSGNTTHYMGTNLSNGQLYSTTSSGSAITFIPMTLITKETIQEVEDTTYEITNTPLKEETSVKVNKEWDLGMATSADYERAQVTIKLIANGKDTGRTVTLSLKNNWTDTFLGLPYKDEAGNVIEYTVEESWETKDWKPVYGEVITVGGGNNRIPTYETTVTNSYNWGHGYQLPETGGPGTLLLLLCGLVTMTCAAGCLYLLRRKQEGGYG